MPPQTKISYFYMILLRDLFPVGCLDVCSAPGAVRKIRSSLPVPRRNRRVKPVSTAARYPFASLRVWTLSVFLCCLSGGWVLTPHFLPSAADTLPKAALSLIRSAILLHTCRGSSTSGGGGDDGSDTSSERFRGSRASQRKTFAWVGSGRVAYSTRDRTGQVILPTSTGKHATLAFDKAPRWCHPMQQQQQQQAMDVFVAEHPHPTITQHKAR